MEGIVIGTVIANWDENHPGMIQAEFLLGPAGVVKTDWIPVMTPFGGASYGSYLLPEVGNTVVIGFEHGSGSHPVVLGCLWSHDNPMPEKTANKDNSRLVWRSKSGYALCVEEQEQAVTWTDPEGENTFSWSTKDKTLTLDVKEKLILNIGGESFLTVEKGSITVTGALKVTAEDVTVTGAEMKTEATGNLELKGNNIKLSPEQGTQIAGNKAEITSSQSVTIKTGQLKAEGTTVQCKGTQTSVEGTTLELKAQASGKLTASGILEVKGTMVKLN